MAVVKFTLSEEGVSVLRDALSCLGKFSDEVSLEAKRDQLALTALNSTKTAYASFVFTTARFFSVYHYEGVGQHRERFFCKLYNKALQSLFRPRSGDPLHEREKDTTIDRCDVAIVDEPAKKSRFIARIVFRNGMSQSRPPVRAKFDRGQATNHWSISSRMLRQLMDHFGPGTEYLDIHSDDDQFVNFTCFTEKVAHGDEVLKKPLHTSIAVERDEFESFEVEEERLHIVISVKDFRALVQHASISGGEIFASYSLPSQPMQLKYDGAEIKCEFLLMTVGERGAPGQKAKTARANAKVPRQQLEAGASRATSHAPTPVRQPVQQPAAQSNPMLSLRPSISRPSQRPPPATLQDESLFVPQENEDQWEPVNLGEDEDEEDNARLEWDASGIPHQSSMNMRSMIANQTTSTATNAAPELPSQFEPSQRLSDVRKFGLFGE
ncbi:hypothetical protein DL766_005018 [Monosporascus sp. MC13-8B]|uniref:DNA repair protein rad9 n=1 Tax=Monosporascus cannonballus TaxID=155416 RepID=A0ABY0H8P4_9PEZI|nr:hypothetical protein DL762_004106 [Monosporascus cannonballus]RYO94372.1 hypothetical protein DL763_004088 [Monosporascus cannonballus]RYP30190.1 hypothetical protein DL766_005018 [Monosporascus sp. MC13-8B]